MLRGQPKWKMIANLGDVNPIDHGGAFVYVDMTGQYEPQIEVLEPTDDDESRYWTVYRFSLERCSAIQADGRWIVSANEFHPMQPEWFSDSLDSVADNAGIEPLKLRHALIGHDAIELANAYLAISGYHGLDNFDEYPLTFRTRSEVAKRYAAWPRLRKSHDAMIREFRGSHA